MKCPNFTKKQCKEADDLAKKWLGDYKEAKKRPEEFKEKYYTKDQIKDMFEVKPICGGVLIVGKTNKKKKLSKESG